MDLLGDGAPDALRTAGYRHALVAAADRDDRAVHRRLQQSSTAQWVEDAITIREAN
jgi:hypothetical protein